MDSKSSEKVQELYVENLKMTEKIRRTAIINTNVVIDGRTYTKVSKKPRGKNILYKLQSQVEPNTEMIIYE